MYVRMKKTTNDYGQINKEDISSPTIAFEALLYTLMVDTIKEQDVATIDLLGYFLLWLQTGKPDTERYLRERLLHTNPPLPCVK